MGTFWLVVQVDSFNPLTSHIWSASYLGIHLLAKGFIYHGFYFWFKAANDGVRFY